MQNAWALEVSGIIITWEIRFKHSSNVRVYKQLANRAFCESLWMASHYMNQTFNSQLEKGIFFILQIL